MIRSATGAMIASAAAALAAASVSATTPPTTTMALPEAKVSAMSAIAPMATMHVVGTGMETSTSATSVSASSSSVAAVIKCVGINACKGKGSCASASNACAGQNGCKGKGWVVVPTAQTCKDQKGTVMAEKDSKPPSHT